MLCNKKSFFLISFHLFQEVAVSTFLEDLTDLLNDYTIPNEHFKIAGDVNIQMETDDANSIKTKDYETTCWGANTRGGTHTGCSNHSK